MISKAVLTFSWVWVRPPAPGWRTHASHAWRCRRCGCTRSHRCSRDRVTFEPTSPCRTEEESPQIQRAGIQGVLAGEGCSGCYHEERSLTKKKKVRSHHRFLTSLSTIITALMRCGASLVDAAVSGGNFWSARSWLRQAGGGGELALGSAADELGWHYKHFWKPQFSCFWHITLPLS